MKPVLTFFIVLFLVSCSNKVEEAKELVNKNQTIIETGYDVEIMPTENGLPEFKIIASVVKRHLTKKPFLEFPEGFKMFTYNDSLQVVSELSAGYGIADENGEDMTAKRNVTVVNKKGETLYTEELLWDQKNKKLISNTFVKVKTPDEIIIGNGLEAKEDFSDYVIKDITGIIQVEAGEFGIE